VRISPAVHERGVVARQRHAGHSECVVLVTTRQAFEQPLASI
jgi:hypothetical protein